ncbi:unnamed protein product [Amoebophrya sp. A120]|nr:unnamed protein product [Amoebophrya sp. A120]|eukprot:GSA120T00016175001.1
MPAPANKMTETGSPSSVVVSSLTELDFSGPLLKFLTEVKELERQGYFNDEVDNHEVGQHGTKANAKPSTTYKELWGGSTEGEILDVANKHSGEELFPILFETSSRIRDIKRLLEVNNSSSSTSTSEESSDETGDDVGSFSHESSSRNGSNKMKKTGAFNSTSPTRSRSSKAVFGAAKSKRKSSTTPMRASSTSLLPSPKQAKKSSKVKASKTTKTSFFDEQTVEDGAFSTPILAKTTTASSGLMMEQSDQRLADTRRELDDLIASTGVLTGTTMSSSSGAAAGTAAGGGTSSTYKNSNTNNPAEQLFSTYGYDSLSGTMARNRTSKLSSSPSSVFLPQIVGNSNNNKPTRSSSITSINSAAGPLSTPTGMMHDRGATRNSRSSFFTSVVPNKQLQVDHGRSSSSMVHKNSRNHKASSHGSSVASTRASTKETYVVTHDVSPEKFAENSSKLTELLRDAEQFLLT